MVFTTVFVPVSLVGFYFATQCVQSPFPSTPFLLCFVSPLDSVELVSGVDIHSFGENRWKRGCLSRALWGSGRTRIQITNRSEAHK